MSPDPLPDSAAPGAFDLVDLAGASFGPSAFRTLEERASEFVAVTTDDADRWREVAPPGYAAALLFTIAPSFLSDPRVEPYTGVLIHSEQRFVWHRALRLGSELEVSARVESVRERSGMYFVGFRAEATEGGAEVLESRSTFLMGRGDPATAGVHGSAEPGPHERAESVVPDYAATADQVELPKSASRADLVRYAAATSDWNPIHWDHEAARAAGLPGIVVHGLLMGAWVCQAATAVVEAPGYLGSLRLRFKKPLRPAAPALTWARRNAAGGIDLGVRSEGEDLVTGSAEERQEAE